MIAAAASCSRASLSPRCTFSSAAILPLRDLIGAYAGEIGQTQFLPSSYIKYGVDYDGDGHVDLRHSVPDVLASTANLLKVNGWRAGAPFGDGTGNFEVMREWNHAEIYRKAWCCLRSGSRRHSERLGGLKVDLPATTREAKIKVEFLCAS